MASLRCALALTGGVAKGAFHAGVLKSLAEFHVYPSVIVGASAGAINGGLVARLIAEDQFTPEKVHEQIIRLWIQDANLRLMWAEAEPNDRSLRGLLGDTRLNVHSLRKQLSLLEGNPLSRLRELLSLRFTSLFSAKHFRDTLNKVLSPPANVVRDIYFSAAMTSLIGEIEFYEGQPIVGYGQYESFHLYPGMNQSEIQDIYRQMRLVVQASSSFPGMFPPVAIHRNGKVDYYTDGGLTKNGPFGRAIKLDPTVTTIFLVSSMPLTEPTFDRIDNFLSVVGQIYKIILNKDFLNDYRKIIQINKRIEQVGKMLQRDENGQILTPHAFNEDLLRLAGFRDLPDYLSKRVVNIVMIEPNENLEGDPFSGLYRQDRERIMRDYAEIGYQTGKRVLTRFFAHRQIIPDS